MDHVYQTKLPISETRILRLFVSVCKGLSAMHNCSAEPLAHNDVKVRGHLACDCCFSKVSMAAREFAD